MGETGDPCGIPFWTGSILLHVPSMHMAASLFEWKLWFHFMYSKGMCFLQSSCSSRLWFTKLKYPLMLNVSADITLPWFHAVWTSVMNVMMASSVEELDLLLN